MLKKKIPSSLRIGNKVIAVESDCVVMSLEETKEQEETDRKNLKKKHKDDVVV